MIGITGGTGVLGSHLIELLKEKGEEFSVYRGDVRDLEQVCEWVRLDRPDYLIHFAAKVPVTEVTRSPVNALEVNAIGTFNVLRAIEAHQPDCWLFYASTSHVYQSKGAPISENDTISPQTVYGETKYMGERVVRYFMEQAQIKACVGRIFSFYDERQAPQFLYPAILKRLKEHDKSQPFKVSNGDDVRDIMPARDIVLLIEKIRKKKFEGILNIGSGKGIRIVDFVRSIVGSDVNIVVEQQRTPSYLIADIEKLNKVIYE